MPQQRSDQHHPPGTPTMMHTATAAGPPIVAPSPAYSAQYFTCSPQQFASQPLVQQMPHYQSQVRFALPLSALQQPLAANSVMHCWAQYVHISYSGTSVSTGRCYLFQMFIRQPLVWQMPAVQQPDGELAYFMCLVASDSCSWLQTHIPEVFCMSSQWWSNCRSKTPRHFILSKFIDITQITTSFHGPSLCSFLQINLMSTKGVWAAAGSHSNEQNRSVTCASRLVKMMRAAAFWNYWGGLVILFPDPFDIEKTKSGDGEDQQSSACRQFRRL